MSPTIGFTGMDSATESALAAAFEEANARLGARWKLLPEAEADHVVVDMDSMYGPMSWIRLHGAGKRVIGLSSATRTQTDFQLLRPFDARTFATLLDEMSTHTGAADVPGDAAAAGEPIGTASPTPPPAATAAPSPTPVPATPAPPPGTVAHATGPAATSPKSALASASTDASPERQHQQADKKTAPPEPPAPAPTPTVPVVPQDPVFPDLLAYAVSNGRQRLRRNGSPALLIDPVSRQYHGPALLKPLSAYFDGSLHARDFEALDDAAWVRETAALGAPQPLSRLQWYGALLAGKGTLLPGLDPAGRYRLGKWPQTEREFPKHFRIATAMMKGPATLDEVAAASGVTLAEVADFVNANIATGYAEFVPEPPPEPTEPPKPAGLFGRLRHK